MRKSILFFILFPGFLFSQVKFKTEEVKAEEFLVGTLYTPEEAAHPDLVILIAGSGPTDRNGNHGGTENNSLKYLAEGLAGSGTAVFAYDKRFLTQIKMGITPDETKLTFNDFVNDAVTVIDYFKKTKKYRRIIVAGHSEGSWIGMAAANAAKADAYISISGPGNPIDMILEKQIKLQAPFLLEETKSILAKLKNGETARVQNPALNSLFRPSVQPFMISMLKFNPQEEIKKLRIPVLIVNGANDIQVPSSEAELLKKARPESTLVIIENMSHVLKDVNAGDGYTDTKIPVMPELIKEINEFLKSV